VGLLDTLRGRSKPVRANLDALFALPSAAVTLATSAGLVPSGHAGVCWKPPAGQSVTELQAEINQLLELPDDPVDDLDQKAAEATAAPVPATGSAPPMTQAEDAYGFRWLLLSDPNLEDLVTRVHVVNSSLTDAGWGPQLLCSVFGLVPGPGAGSEVHPLYLVYLYKRGTFYPFAPNGKESRDTELELRVQALLGTDLPVEKDLTRWFPLWDLPVH
jgi:hypothetical protein